jgi:hypothetical protein
LLDIALAGFETDSKRADFLRSFGLARLPKSSIICARAGEMLLAQDRPKLALDSVDQALLADPTDLSAQPSKVRLQRVSRMVSYPTPRIFPSFAISPVIGFGRREINRQISFLPAVQPQKGVGSTVEPGWAS